MTGGCFSITVLFLHVSVYKLVLRYQIFIIGSFPVVGICWLWARGFAVANIGIRSLPASVTAHVIQQGSSVSIVMPTDYKHL